MIELQNLRRTFGEKVAVENLSLSIPSGELFAFLGPNGAGKTTTIKMLVGLLQPNSGSIGIQGEDVIREPRRAAHVVGYVPDEPCLYDKLSGREFLHFVADLFGLSASTAAANIEREIQCFSLESFIDHLTESYSHGMKQRLVFAAALLHDPSVLILDEPMVGLDPQNARVVKNRLKSLSQAGVTIFMSTHVLSLAEEIADRIGIVYGGRLRFLGTMKELRAKMEREEDNLEQLFLAVTNDEQPTSLASSP